MPQHADLPGPRLATRLAFFAAGFAIACWAPLIPFAKSAVGADDATFGLILLCLGVGSFVAMPLTGWMSARLGARPMVLGGGIGLVLFLPPLLLAQGPVALALVLMVFGASLGTIDVAMNIHGIEVEKRGDRPLMSGFHAMYSVGGLIGAGVVTGLLTLGATPVASAFAGAAVTLAAIVVAAPRLLSAQADAGARFALPHGIVLLIAGLCAIAFLVEGAVLDWGALLIIDRGLAATERAGLGYVVFSVAMTLGRLTGDRLIASVGNLAVLIWGGLITVLGIAAVVLAPGMALALAGFGLIGIGASNIVPVFFSLAGRQKIMPPGMAVAAVTTAGYGGILAGPAGIGFVADAFSLTAAFWMLAVLMALVPLAARRVVRI